MKRYLALFISFVLVFNFTFISFSYADTIDNLITIDPEEVTTYPNTGDTSNPPPEYTEGTGTNDDVDYGIFIFIIEMIISILNPWNLAFMAITFLLPSIDGCILNRENTFRISYFDETPSGISAGLRPPVAAIYNALRYLVTAIYIVILVYLAIRMMLSSVGKQKALYKDLFKHWLIGLLLLFSFHWVMAGVIWLSNALVGILADIESTILQDVTLSIPTEASNFIFSIILKPLTSPINNYIITKIGSGATMITKWFSVTGIFMNLIICGALYIFYIGTILSIVVTYFKRLLTITILILVFPLVSLSYVFDKIGDRKAQTLSLWLKEFMTNILIQPLHALILVFIAIIFAASNDSLGSVFLFGANPVGAAFSIFTLRLIPLGETFLKKLFQINSSMGPGSQGIAGSMAKTGLAIRGMQDLAGKVKQVGGTFAKVNAMDRAFKHNMLPQNLKNKTPKSYIDAFNEARKSGKNLRDSVSSGIEQHNQNRQDRKAEANWLRNARKTDDYKVKYKEHMENLKSATNSKTATGVWSKTFSPLAAAALGAGTAVTGADQFLSEAASRAVMASSAATALSNAPSALDKAIHGDTKKQEYFNRLADTLEKYDFSKLSPKQRADLSLKTGLDIEFFANDSRKGEIIDACRTMGTYRRFNSELKTEQLVEFTKFHKEHKNAEKGMLADGTTFEEAYSKIDPGTPIMFSNKGQFASINGKFQKISNLGMDSLKDGEFASFTPGLEGKFASDSKAIIAANDPTARAKAKQLSAATAELTKLTAAKDDSKTTLDALRADPNASQTDIENAETSYREAVTAEARQRSYVTKVNGQYNEAVDKAIETQIEIGNIITQSGGKPYYVENAYASTLSSSHAEHCAISQNDRSIIIDAYGSKFTIDQGNPNLAGGEPARLNTATAQSARAEIEQVVMQQHFVPGTTETYQVAYERISSEIANSKTTEERSAALSKYATIETLYKHSCEQQLSDYTNFPNTIPDTLTFKNELVLNSALKTTMGQDYISNAPTPPPEPYSYGVCDDLKTIMAMPDWKNKENIQMILTYNDVDNTVTCEVFNKFATAPLYSLKINNFNKETMFGDPIIQNPIILSLVNGSWIKI